MRVFHVRNVHDALPMVMDAIKTEGVERNSRNGKVLMFPTPVTTVYEKPLERVIFHDDRDANPFFHLMEALWMLAGRNDVAFPAYFVKTMKNFSDDGKTFHAAYGHRWRQHFGFDQLQPIIEMLKKNPEDRRAVLTMWDPKVDGMGRDGKDFACNLQCIFSVNVHGNLDMMVTNRSNDIIWGAYGANAVHFSYLQEFMAAGVGVPVGQYYQVANNFHAYEATYEKVKDISVNYHSKWNPYGEITDDGIFPLVSTPMEEWHQDLLMFMEHGGVVGLRDPFFRRVATPMLNAFNAYKDKDNPERFDNAKDIIKQCKDVAWMTACLDWIIRREEKANAKTSNQTAMRG